MALVDASAYRRVGPWAVARQLVAEFAGVAATVRRTSFWSWFGFAWILAVAATVGMLPFGWVALVLQVFGFALVCLLVVWPEVIAYEMRKDDELAIRDRDGAAVVTYLPVAVALFALPYYLVAQATLFRNVMERFPGVLPGSGWGDAWRLSIDNLLFTELFLDVFDVLGVGLAGDTEHVAGRVLVFITRLLLSVGFVRVAVSLLRAAYYRAHGLGRGADVLSELDEAVDAGDAVRVGHLGREIANDMRGTVDAVVHRLLEADALDPVRRDNAYRSLRALRDWAIPALRVRILHGDARSSDLEDLVSDLESERSGDEQTRPRTRPERVVAVAASAVVIASLVVWAPAPVAFAVGVACMVTLVWLLASPRATYEAAIEGGLVPFVRLEVLRGATLVSSTVLAVVFLLVSWATVWNAATLWPGSFEVVRGPLGPGSVLGFLGASLIRVQAFFSLPDVFRIGEPAIEQRPWVGSLLTLTLRTGLNLGFVAVVVTALSVRRDRDGFSGLLSVPDELGMRMEALRGGRYALGLVSHYAERVGGRLWTALDAADGSDVQDALASSGVFDWLTQYDLFTKPESPEQLRSQAALIEAIQRRGWETGRWVAELDAALGDEEWPLGIRAQVLARRAVMAVRDLDANGGVAMLEDSYELVNESLEALTEDDRREVMAVWARSVMRAVTMMPPHALATRVTESLATRALEMLDALAALAPERFTVDALRAGTLLVLIRARTGRTTGGLEERARLVDDTLALPATHPWRETLLYQVLGALAAVSGMAEAAGVDEGAEHADLELRVMDALGGELDDLIVRGLTVRHYDPCLGEELSAQVWFLLSLPPSRASLVTAERAAALFEAYYALGVLEARGSALAMRMSAAQMAIGLGAHHDVVGSADAAFRLVEGMRTGWPVRHLLANTHAYCARAKRALGSEEDALRHAATARALYESIAVSGWEGAEYAGQQGKANLAGFEGLEA